MCQHGHKGDQGYDDRRDNAHHTTPILRCARQISTVDRDLRRQVEGSPEGARVITHSQRTCPNANSPSGLANDGGVNPTRSVRQPIRTAASG
jgi:hypothetical protein